MLSQASHAEKLKLGAEILNAETQRIALVIQYIGTHFHGWQYQPNQRTVQSEIESILSRILQQRVVLHAAGRTDSGVHAAAQVAHFDAPMSIPAHRWMSILNHRLPADIVIRAACVVPNNWHARFSALWRRYRYTIYCDPLPNVFLAHQAWHLYRGTLDVARMQTALQPLHGHHHLSAFRRAGSERAHSWVEIQSAQCYQQDACIYVELQASGFLYGMVRLIVGLLVDVGYGKLSPEDFTRLWQMEQRDQVRYAAPPQGLCLLRIGYSDFPVSASAWFDAQPKPWFSESDLAGACCS